VTEDTHPRHYTVQGKLSLPLTAIKLDAALQQRALVRNDVIKDWTEQLEENKQLTFPPLKVFYDGKTNWLADGFQRWHAYKEARRETVDVEVYHGSHDDALVYSFGANATHGVHRTADDKWKAVTAAIAFFPDYSDRYIASVCLVSHTFVAKVRASHTGNVASKRTEVRRGTSDKMMDVSKNVAAKPEPETTPAAKPWEVTEGEPEDPNPQVSEEPDEVEPTVATGKEPVRQDPGTTINVEAMRDTIGLLEERLAAAKAEATRLQGILDGGDSALMKRLNKTEISHEQLTVRFNALMDEKAKLADKTKSLTAINKAQAKEIAKYKKQLGIA
jgi:hypothetical protein